MFKLLFNLLLIGACAGIFFLPTYGISAKYADIQSIKQELEQYTEANNNAKKLAEKRDELQNKFNSYNEAQRSRLVTFLPDNIDPIRFILEMEGIGKKLGVPIKGASYGTLQTTKKDQSIAVGDSTYGTYTFSFSSEGSYNTMLTTLRELEKSLRLMDVTSLTLTAPQGVDPSGRPVDYYTYNIRLNTYWLK